MTPMKKKAAPKRKKAAKKKAPAKKKAAKKKAPAKKKSAKKKAPAKKKAAGGGSGSDGTGPKSDRRSPGKPRR